MGLIRPYSSNYKDRATSAVVPLTLAILIFSMKLLASIALTVLTAVAETRTLTLKEAVDLAVLQNPDVVIARLDEQKAALETRAATEPLLPRLTVGSGLAWTSGFPLSIEGAAPSVIRAEASRSLYNAPQKYQVAQARELARSASLGAGAARDEAVLRTALLFLDLEKVTRGIDVARRQVENLERVEAAVRHRVQEGREIELEARKASVALARARQRVFLLSGQQALLARALAGVIGIPPSDTILPAAAERLLPELPATEEDSVSQSLAASPHVRKLESQLLAKGFEERAIRANRLPTVDLVAQYGLFARFNNYEDYFRTFTRHNGQIGASIRIPVFPDARDQARAAKAGIEAQRLRAEIASTRNSVQTSTRNAWLRIREAESQRDLAKLDLDLSREQVSVLLAQTEEGRATLRQIEEARFQENERWLSYYDARYSVERARLELLRDTGTLLAAIR